MRIARFIIGSFIYFMTPASLFAQGFRGILWNTSLAEVIRREGRPLSQDGAPSGLMISYKKKVGSIGIRDANFLFSNDKLNAGRYFLGELTEDQINSLFNSLSEKYGPGKRAESSFRWTTKDTIIVLNNFPFGGQVLSYYEKGYFRQLAKEQERQKKEGL